jgi:hypothetical protein
MIFCEFGWGMDGRLLFMDSERNFFLRLSVTFKVCKGQTLLKAELVKTVIGIISLICPPEIGTEIDIKLFYNE